MLNIEIITPDKTLFSGEGIAITLPGIDGKFQILTNHAPIIASLAKGEVVIDSKQGKQTVAITGGLVEVNKNKVIVLA